MTAWRIRRCDSNRDAWLLVRVRTDGTESDSCGSRTTSLSLAGLFAKGWIEEGDDVEVVL